MSRKTLAFGEVADRTDEQYPPELREDWDRVRLTCGDRQGPVTKILLAADPTEVVVGEALERGTQLIITHRSLFLRGAFLMSIDMARGRVMHRLIHSHAGLSNMHTNADVAAGGVAEILTEVVGLATATWRSLELNPNHPELGISRVGDLSEPYTLGDLANRLAGILPDSPAGLPVARDLDREVRTVAVSGGSGRSLLEAACESGAEVFVTVDLRHHPALDYHEESGALALLVPPH